MKAGRTGAAVETYEKAVGRYADGGFPNNAIALCNKVLRNAPGRTPIYFKLAKLMLERGFTSEAKRNLLEYAERMQRAGQLEEAFNALREFADLSPDNEEIRLLLAEQLKAAARTDEAREQLSKLYAEVESHGDRRRIRSTLDKMRLIDPEYDVESAPKPKVERRQKTSDLIFLDLDDEPAAPVEPVPLPVEEPYEPELPLIEDAEVEAAEPAIDPTSLVEAQASADAEAAATVVPLEFEPTALGEESVEETAEEEPAPIEPATDVEPTALIEPEAVPADVERISVEYLEPEEPVAAVDGLDVEREFESPVDSEVASLEIEPTAVGEEVPEMAAAAAEPVVDEEAQALPEPVAQEPTVEAAEPVEETETAAAAEDLIIEYEEPLKIQELEGRNGAELGVEVESGIWEDTEVGAIEVPDIDVSGLEAVLAGQEGETADAFAEIASLDLVDQAEVEVPPPDVDALESRVADDPENADLHRTLAEALIEAGERERGLEELEITLRLHEAEEAWGAADGVVREILRLEPNSVRHHQKRVELAFHRGDKSELADSYLGLADALLREGATDRARAVYHRVLEHDALNERAQLGLATLAPAEDEAGAEVGETVAQKSPLDGEFIDLGALILDDDELREMDTRMRIEDEEPTGDEQRDFEEMLSEFKRGIEANLADEDWQAHYDLGVAFKEMGLLDEAITEFQKALRSPEGRLKTAEALGGCFFERGQYSVAATVLRRAVDSDGSGDDSKIGLLYWLGRCEEQLGKRADALAHYQRVFSIDIGFQDVRQRVSDLAEAES
ncbi:MAG: tetratricopeptide repeat protein [Gemmatimonadales bacterium]|nr:tetratricopeptide repeat protein [Gemmatimonadales bacterium]